MKQHSEVFTFKDFVMVAEDADIANELCLPITHVPDWKKIGLIMHDGKLVCSKNNKNYENEELLFFTYGRNTFIPGDKKDLENDIYPPLAFLFDLRKVKQNPIRILPFDSGGYHLYKVPDGMTIRQFEVNDPAREDSLKLVVLLYKGYAKYMCYEHDFLDLVRKFNLFPELQVLNHIYTEQMSTSTEIGPQGRSIEIHYGDPIPLEPLLILFPHKYAGAAYDPSALMARFPGVKLIMYTSETPGGGGPKVYRNFINEQIADFIDKNKDLFKWTA